MNFTNTLVLNLNLKFFHICGDDVVMTWQVTWHSWVMWQVTWPNWGDVAGGVAYSGQS